MYRYVIGPVRFNVARPEPISLKIEKVRTISVELSNVTIGGVYDVYPGPYAITPRVYEQTMNTENLLMEQDVLIYSIPLTEVSNIQGGKTATIG